MFWKNKVYNYSTAIITIKYKSYLCLSQDDGGMWETVTLKSSIIKKYHLVKQDQQGHQKLYLDLDIAGRDILHFCPSSKKTAVITFDANVDLTVALSASLGDEKFQQGPPTVVSISQPSSVEMWLKWSNVSDC